MLPILRFFLFGLVFVVFSVLSLSAEEYYVSLKGSDSAGRGTEESPWKSVSKAVQSIPDDGSTILVKDGLYSGSLSFSRHFRYPCTIRAENAYRARFSSPTQSNRVLYLSDASNIIFRGLEFFGSGSKSTDYLMQISTKDANHLMFEDCIIHDSYKNDLIKINDRAHKIVFSGCVFFNPTNHGGDEHFDINTVEDIIIEKSIFFNDYIGSSRPEENKSHSFIVIKNSGSTPDVCKNVVLRKNIFHSWAGLPDQTFILLGEDGKPFFEASEILIENNLFLHHSEPRIIGTFLYKGGLRGITTRANTITGRPNSKGFSVFSVVCFNIGNNPKIEKMVFANNLFCNNHGGINRFSSTYGERFVEGGFRAINNLYWNGGYDIISEEQDLFAPEKDSRAILGDPKMKDVPRKIPPSRFDLNTNAFPTGNRTIREEFESLVLEYAALEPGSEAIGNADPKWMPQEDILGKPRSKTRPDIGCFETEKNSTDR